MFAQKAPASSKRKQSFSGFTLVELIVVITILVILGTIAFLSLAGFSASARDSSRVSDLANISQSLDLHGIRTGSYPTPDNAFSVTYSGWVLWSQGTVGDTVMNVITAGWAKMSRKPNDPLNPLKEYTYSTLSFWKAGYQLKTDYEGDRVSYNNWRFFPLASAAPGNPSIVYLKGNYNGVVAKTQTGNTIYLIATPSIITSYSGTVGSGYDIISLSDTMFTHGSSNSGGIAYAAKLTFASGALPSTDAERILFSSGIALAYSGTSLGTQSNITPFIEALTSNNSGTLASIGGSSISAWFGGSASTALPASQVPPAPAYSSAMSYVANDRFTYNGVTVTVSGSGKGTTDSMYLNCPSADLAIWTDGAPFPQVWSLCNVGANTVSTSFQPDDSDSSYATQATWGKYFQWGEDIAWNDSLIATSSDNCTWNRDTQSCGASVLGTWQTSVSDTGSGGVSRWHDWSISDNRGPCAAGYHVPTPMEWQAAYTILWSERNIFLSTLKIPMAGYRVFTDGEQSDNWTHGYYWASSPDGEYAHMMNCSTNYVDPITYAMRADGLPIRCIKN